MSQPDFAPLRRMMADPATRVSVDALRAELTRKAVSKSATEDDRQQSLLMLWAFDALMVKISNSIPE